MYSSVVEQPTSRKGFPSSLVPSRISFGVALGSDTSFVEKLRSRLFPTNFIFNKNNKRKMKTNIAKKTVPIFTHEGGIAKHINAEQQLRRSVMSCMLFEGEFYEDGQSIAARIAETIKNVRPEAVAAIAVEAREKMKLRHVPLLIVREMARLESHRDLVAETLSRIIQRADELSEFVAIYWKDKRQPLSAQVKRGLASAFQKFSEYDLAKYNGDSTVKLRDVLFLCHAKAKDAEQAALWKRLIDGQLKTPDTWEVALSGGADKKGTWLRLISEKKLGALAMLRNLRNMQEAKIGDTAIREGLNGMKTERVLPFRFIAAARFAPQFEPELETAMFKCIEGREKLPGKTMLMIDVSGSMASAISGKSDLARMDAACGLAMLLREVCEHVAITTFSDKVMQIPTRRGFALRDAIVRSQPHSGTYMGQAVAVVVKMEFDRLIVISDEQSAERVPDPNRKAYMVNVASSKNGVGYGTWTHIDGWSEAIVDYVAVSEKIEKD